MSYLAELEYITGTILPFAGNTIPSGWLYCDGSLKLKTEYSNLYTILGTKFGTPGGWSEEIGHSISFIGDPSIESTQYVFDTRSVHIQNVTQTGNNWLESPASSDWNLGPTGSGNDWTIDFRIRFESIMSWMNFMAASDGSNGWQIQWRDSDDKFYLHDGSYKVCSGTWLPVIDTWYHVAFVKNGTTITAYIDGTSVGTFTDVDMNNDSQKLMIGKTISGSYSHHGWMDEIRISKGVARWTSNFTSPTSAYTSDIYDVFLLHFGETYISNFNLPDMRGFFQRGWNKIGGTDRTGCYSDPECATRCNVCLGGCTGNNMGTCQHGCLECHYHGVRQASGGPAHTGGVWNVINHDSASPNGIEDTCPICFCETFGSTENRAWNVAIKFMIRY